ncbi:pilus assembly protein TadC [Psychromonas sp. Urea-02u-13]|nr:pilus assembly protein TadC [Psychromonas sp. Urea-02u-13]
MTVLLLQEQQHKNIKKQCQRYLFSYVETTELTSKNSGFSKIGLLYPVSGKEAKRLMQLLEQAGFHHLNALNQVRAAKLLFGLSFALLTLIWQLTKTPEISAMTVMFILVFYVIGSNIPEYWLKRSATKARQAQQHVVPDAIDLLVISVEAGLSLDRAIEKVGHYLRHIEPGLSAHFLRTHAEMIVMGDQAECMRKLGWRSGLEELKRLANTLVMAQKYGSPLADTMRTISEDARLLRKISLEEQAGKLPGRITLIQMAFIMLPLLVLIIAPTMNLLLESLK